MSLHKQEHCKSRKTMSVNSSKRREVLDTSSIVGKNENVQDSFSATMDESNSTHSVSFINFFLHSWEVIIVRTTLLYRSRFHRDLKTRLRPTNSERAAPRFSHTHFPPVAFADRKMCTSSLFRVFFII